MKLNRQLHFFCIFAVAGTAALQSATGAAAEYRIGSSIATFDCTSVRPGDRVVINGGERGPLKIQNCYGSSSLPITISNDVSADSPVIIRRTSGAAGGFLFVIDNSRYIVVDGAGGWRGMQAGAYCGAPNGKNGCGIQVTSVASGDAPTAYYAISGQNMRDQVHKGIMVDGTGSYQSSAGDGRIGVLFNDHSQPSYGPLRENVTLTRNYIRGVWGEGMYLGANPSQNTTPLGDIEVSYNLVENTGRDGVEMKSVYRGVASVVGNFAINVGRRSDSAGQQNGLTVGGNSVFEKNFVRNAGEAGIRAIAYNETPGTGPFRSEIFNNIVVGSGVAGQNDGHGISISATTGFTVNTRVFNNTVVENLGRGINVTSQAGPGEVWNNIAVGNKGGDVNVSPAGSVVRNNRTGTAGSVGFLDALNRNFRLQSNSPAIDAASDASPATDFDGKQRPLDGASDQGAFEFGENQIRPEPPQSLSVR